MDYKIINQFVIFKKLISKILIKMHFKYFYLFMDIFFVICKLQKQTKKFIITIFCFGHNDIFAIKDFLKNKEKYYVMLFEKKFNNEKFNLNC